MTVTLQSNTIDRADRFNATCQVHLRSFTETPPVYRVNDDRQARIVPDPAMELPTEAPKISFVDPFVGGVYAASLTITLPGFATKVFCKCSLLYDVRPICTFWLAGLSSDHRTLGMLEFPIPGAIGHVGRVPYAVPPGCARSQWVSHGGSGQ